MKSFVLIEPTKLFNLLNQESVFPCVSDLNYLVIYDARSDEEYDESHIITAKRTRRDDLNQFYIPYDAELECKTHVVVYDGNTKSKKVCSSAIEYAELVAKFGSKNPVKVLRGGYEDFSALYPFLRSQKIIYMPQELDNFQTYPCEVIPGMVYIGNLKHAHNSEIHEDLKIEAHVNVSCTKNSSFTNKENFYKEINVEDTIDSDLLSYVDDIVKFIDFNRENSRTVLVWSKNGISRSATICILYLMSYYKWNLKQAWNHLIECKADIRPNRGFVSQLSSYEEKLMSDKITDISDPLY